MKIEKLSLRNFRNLEDCSFVPDPGLNFLVGPNGQGKTSALEALGYLATLRSFRDAKAIEVIRHGSDSAEIECILSDADWQTQLKIVFQKTDGPKPRASKLALINGKVYRSSTQYLTQRFGSFELGFHTVVFNPSDHDLVRTDPSARRSYLDRVLAAEDVSYLQTLQKYQRVVDQRNALLKAMEKPDRDLLSGFTEPMAVYAAELTLKRLKWIQNAAPTVNNIAHQIAPNQPLLGMFYLSNWVPEIEDLSFNSNKLEYQLTARHFAGHGPLPSLELLEQAFWKRVSELEAAEFRAGHSLVGPHRDDWIFVLGDQPLKGRGSQGEVRSALLALKLAEVELFRNATGHRPFFLLDDFSSELDRERRAFLLRFLTETDLQVFVTTTEDTVTAGRRFLVWNGSIHEHGTRSAELG